MRRIYKSKLNTILTIVFVSAVLVLPFWAKAEAIQEEQVARGGVVFGPILYAVGGYNPPNNNSAWGNSAWQTCEEGCPAW